MEGKGTRFNAVLDDDSFDYLCGEKARRESECGGLRRVNYGEILHDALKLLREKSPLNPQKKAAKPVKKAPQKAAQPERKTPKKAVSKALKSTPPTTTSASVESALA